jgi:uncharacterized protein involved in outer membrane biogenesis
VIIGGLFVLALTVALVGPYFIDWTSYRADFERQASVLLGRQVTVNGAAEARLLPFPSVTFNDVTVAGDTPGEPAMRAEQFSMDMELAPFVRGEVLIFDMRLIRPDILMRIGEDGRLDWALKPEAYFDASRVSLENFRIVEGKLRIRHGPSGREHLVSEINTDISARALSGPWRIDGSMRFDGVRSSVGISTGAAGEDGRMRLRVRVQPERYPLTVESDGGIEMVAGAPHYAGTFNVGLGNAGKPAAGQKAAPPAYRARGAFALDHRRLDVTEFRLETGPADDPYTADGTAFLDFAAEPRFSVTADGAQIRMEEPAPAEGEAPGISLGKRLAALREFLRELPQPSIPGTVEVRLPAIVAGDTMIRDIGLQAEPDAGAWKIGKLHASLPGRTTLEGQGILRAAEEFSFRGSLLLAVGQPSGFAGWVTDDVNDVIRRLPAAGFGADVDLTESAQKFSNLELILGAARFRGEIERSAPADQRPSLRIALDGEKLDVEGMLAFASLFVGEDGAQRLGNEDVDIELKAGPVLAAGLSAETVDAGIRLRKDAIEIDRLLVGGLEGASVSATGSLHNLTAIPTGNIDADIVAVDLAPLVTRLSQQYPQQRLLSDLAARVAAYPGLLSDARIGLRATGADNGDGSSGISLTAEGTAGGTGLTLSASTNGYRPGSADFPLDIKAEAHNADAAGIYALYGLPALPLGLAGEARTTLAFSGSTATGGSARLDFRGEGLDVSFDGHVAIEGGQPDFAGRGTIKADDLEPWLMAGGVSYPGAGLGLPVSLSARLDIGDSLAVISGLAGSVAGTRIAGDLNMDFVEGLPHFTGDMNAGLLDLRIPAAMVLGTDSLDAKGEGWPTAVFAAEPNLPALFDVALTADRLVLADGWEAGKAQANLKLDKAGLHLSALQGDFAEGRLNGLVELANNGGSGLLSAQLKLESGALAALVPNAGLGGAGDLGISATASGKTVEAMVASLAGSGTLAFRNLTVDGINPDPFGAIIAGADRIGRDIDAAAVAGFAPTLLRQGRFDAGSGEVAFTLASGTLRAPPLRIQTKTADMTADLRADLGARQLNADAAVTYFPGKEEQLVGSEPAVRFSASGPFEAIDVSVDTAPLAQFLTQRALEIEQRRVEAMQAILLEGQRLRRETRYYAALEDARRIAEENRLREEEAARQRALEEERLQRERERAEEEARRRAAEQAATPPPAPAIVSPQPPFVERAPLPQDRPANPLPQAPDTSTIFNQENLRLGGPAAPTNPLSQ